MSGLKAYDAAVAEASTRKEALQQVDTVADVAAAATPEAEHPGNPFISGLTRGSGLGDAGSDAQLKKEIGGSFSGNVGEVVGNVGLPMALGAAGTLGGAALGTALGFPTGGMSIPALAAVGGGLGTTVGAFPGAYGRRRQLGEGVGASISGGIGDAATEGALALAGGAAVGATLKAGNVVFQGAKAILGRYSGKEAAEYAFKTYGSKAASAMANNGVRTFANPLVDAQNVALAQKTVGRQLGEFYDLTKSVPIAAKGFAKAWNSAWEHAVPIGKADQAVLTEMQGTLLKNIFTSDPAINGGAPFIAAKSLQDARQTLKLYLEKSPTAGAAVKKIRDNLLNVFKSSLPSTEQAPLKQTFEKLHGAKGALQSAKNTIVGN